MFLPGNKFGSHSSRKGIPNKSTKEIRELISAFLLNNLSNIQSLYDSLSDRAKTDFIIKLLPIALRFDQVEEMEEQKQITIQFKDFFNQDKIEI